VSTPFLWTGENPNSRVRSNGLRFWGYPKRDGGLDAIGCIVIHTTESEPTKHTARNVATWQRDRSEHPGSYHVIVDSRNTVECLPDIAVAFHVRGFNTPSLGLAFGTRAHLWGRHPSWEEPALKRAAAQAAEWCEEYGIPPKLITASEARAGKRGFCTHARLDPGRRSDPGADFPWSKFLRYVQEALDGTAPADPPADPPPPPSEPTWTETLVENLPTRQRRTNLSQVSEWDQRIQGLLAAAGTLHLRRNTKGGQFDGKFGPSTESAVLTFQQNTNIAVDGIVGPQTWRTLLGR